MFEVPLALCSRCIEDGVCNALGTSNGKAPAGGQVLVTNTKYKVAFNNLNLRDWARIDEVHQFYIFKVRFYWGKP